ncbi:putative protein phosphatase 2C 78 [Platanthera guangdongensis]|uniref:protein-serine/threonine phosphatase n=1 Tax=Platanthera guangdongensis TaxID=2320717 RepID=A0ABR2LKU4_9ASPA
MSQSSCLRQLARWFGWQGGGGRGGGGAKRDGLIWHMELKPHCSGEFSIALAQANSSLEDQGQVLTSPFGTYVGVFDGHGGPEASRFANDRLFGHLHRFASEQGGLSPEVMRKAFAATEEEFLHLVRDSWLSQPQIASVGSCCLVGAITEDMIYVANLGDSRAVLGRRAGNGRPAVAERLSSDHNVAVEEVRKELAELHPDDSHIVVFTRGVWRIKGIIQGCKSDRFRFGSTQNQEPTHIVLGTRPLNPESNQIVGFDIIGTGSEPNLFGTDPNHLVSRSIGDVYLKKPEFCRDPLFQKVVCPIPLKRPVVTAEPSIEVHRLRPHDHFLIFASDGLWEQLTDEDAVDLVFKHPRAGIAKRLVKAALSAAAKKREMRYEDITKINQGTRRHFHDDITVIVIYLDQSFNNSSRTNGAMVDCTSVPIDIFSMNADKP